MNQDLSCPQGYCIIINNNTPTYGEDKLEQIKNVFSTQLGFHIEVYTDLTRKAILRLLSSVASADHTELHCMIVLVLSNGGKQRLVYGSDGKKLHLRELLALFSRDLSPSLADKPKLFFIDTQLDKETGEADELHNNIPDTYMVSYYGQQPSMERNVMIELFTSICNDYVFQDVMDSFLSSYDSSQMMHADNLTKPLHFTKREPR